MKTHHSALSTMYGKGIIDDIFKKSKGDDCFTVKFSEKEHEEYISSSLTLIDVGSKNLNLCIKRQALELIGTGTTIDFRFSVFDRNIKYSKITRVDEFILYIFNYKKIDSKIKLSQIPIVFMKLYPEILKNFSNKEEK